MYSKDEHIIFSILNTYDQKINTNFFYKIFKLSNLYRENIFDMHEQSLLLFLKDKCFFNEKQISKIFYFLNKNFIKNIDISNIYNEAEISNIKILCQKDNDFPKNFLGIKNPPYVIFLKGKFKKNIKFKKIAALVGTRKMSSNAKKFAEEIAIFFKNENIFNVSGLANGCDTIGHQICIENTGAILGQGLATSLYPKKNLKLAEEILENDGFLLSELPPSTNISKNKLIERNRLQSAFADFIVIVETGLKGGTVHTFKYAREQNKKIYIGNFNREFLDKYSKNLISIKNSEDLKRNLFFEEIQKTLF